MKLYLSSIGLVTRRIKYFEKYRGKYLLESYIYFRKMKEEDRMRLVSIPESFILDSGAHTFQKDNNDTDYDKFVYEYAKFINENPKITYYVELDIENKVGLRQVEKWRDYLIEKTKRKPIVVWHRERGWDYYKYMCKKYDYVGFSGFVVDATGGPEVPDKFINLFCDEAHNNGAIIHGFGYTRKGTYKYRFDSIDSSSYASGARFGSIDIFNGKYMKRRKELRNYASLHEQIEENQIREWIKYQYYLDNI